MSEHSVLVSVVARAELDRLDEPARLRIVKKLAIVQGDPRRYLARLHRSRFYRLRVGPWRLVVALDETRRQVVILEVGHRRSVYR